MSHHLRQSLVAVLVATSAGASLAAIDPVAVHATATVSNLQVKLTDLRPSDSVTPSLKNPGQTVALDASGFGVPQNVTLNGLPFDATNGSVSGSTQYVPAGTATATKAGNSLSSQINLSRDTAFTYGSYPYLTQPYATTFARSSANASGSWLLSAGTQLVISGLVTLDAHIDSSATVQKAGAASLELGAESRYSFRVLTQNGLDWKEVDIAQGQLNVLQQSTGYGALTGDVYSDSLSRAFTLTVSNTGTSSMEVRFDFTNATMGSIARATALPEPGTWAFMGLGLGLIAWRVRANRV